MSVHFEVRFVIGESVLRLILEAFLVCASDIFHDHLENILSLYKKQFDMYVMTLQIGFS